MLQKKALTSKLFYKKYPYRITCNIQGCWILRSYGYEKTQEFCSTQRWKYSNWKPSIDRDNLLAFMNVIDSHKSAAKFRFEHDFFDVYVETEEKYREFQAILEPWITGTCEPENQQALEFLLEKQNSKKVICNKLPHGLYKFKIHLRYKTDPEIRKNFLAWSKNYGNKIRIPEQTSQWLEYDSRWQWNPFLYVADNGTLSMVSLFLSGSVTKVEEYIPKMSINTTL